jgi:hypothetical protein
MIAIGLDPIEKNLGLPDQFGVDRGRETIV